MYAAFGRISNSQGWFMFLDKKVYKVEQCVSLNLNDTSVFNQPETCVINHAHPDGVIDIISNRLLEDAGSIPLLIV